MVEDAVYGQIEGFVGHSAATDIQETIRYATVSTGNNFATIVGLIVLLIGATSVFGEIQDSINHIWRLKPKPRKGLAWVKLIINRLLSFSMIITLGFILLVSMVINGSMDYLECTSSMFKSIAHVHNNHFYIWRHIQSIT
jgi:membrane protein